MTCREFIEFLMSYVDEELPASQRAEFERHVGICPSCRAYLDGYRKTLALERELSECDRLPENVPEDLVRAIVKAKKQT